MVSDRAPRGRSEFTSISAEEMRNAILTLAEKFLSVAEGHSYAAVCGAVGVVLGRLEALSTSPIDRRKAFEVIASAMNDQL